MSTGEKIFIVVALGVILVITGDALWFMPGRTFPWNDCRHISGIDTCTFTPSGLVRGICNLGLFLVGNIIVCNAESLKKRRIYS